MSGAVLLEVVGWIGSILLVVSLLQSRMLYLRWLNLAASGILIMYNGVLGVWPMVGMNVAVSVINAIHILRLRRTRPSAAADPPALLKEAPTGVESERRRLDSRPS